MYDLIKVVTRAGDVLYLWMRAGAALSGQVQLRTIEQARGWFARNYAMTYTKPERRSGDDRRDGYERRQRVSEFERRQRPQGRRWTDEVDRYR